MTARAAHWKEHIFSLATPEMFGSCALEIFRMQATHNPVYARYLRLLKTPVPSIEKPEQIPFLPIGFFKTHDIITGDVSSEVVFESSGTMQQASSRHCVADVKLYETSFTKCFRLFHGNPVDYCILALLPSYLERKNSSLVFMADALIRQSQHPLSGFFLHDYAELSKRIATLEAQGQKTLLLGVSFALLDFAEQFPMPLRHTTIMETGGMKGRRKELTRPELHAVLQKAFSVKAIYSEYGMTELLSQAYSQGEGVFNAPPWMKILIRNPQDPFELLPAGTTGGINVIDLANLYSCSFIQTDDIGRQRADGSFEVLGRMDNAEVRGCNLLLG